ncbi:MAG: hypothetical protein ABR507_06935 [Actinomycetota bacterium]|nr:hypothetical protein [Actinomycetota bacterium]
MNISEAIKAGREQRGVFYSSLALTVLGLFFLISSSAGIPAKVTKAIYQVGQSRTQLIGPPGSVPLPSFVSGSFDITIGKKIVGQRLAFKRIRFFSEDGKELGVIPITQVNRQVQATITSNVPGAKAQTVPNIEPVVGSLYLFPLEGGVVSFTAFSTKNFGIKPAQKIFAVVEGSGGLFGFRIRCPVAPATGLGF